MQNFIIMTVMLSGTVFREISQQQMYVLSRYTYTELKIISIYYTHVNDI